MASVYFVTKSNQLESWQPHYLEFIKSFVDLPHIPSPNSEMSASVVVAKFGVSKKLSRGYRVQVIPFLHASQTGWSLNCIHYGKEHFKLKKNQRSSFSGSPETCRSKISINKTNHHFVERSTSWAPNEREPTSCRPPLRAQ